MQKILFYFPLLLFLFASCSSDNEEGLTPKNEDNNNPCNTEEISYESGIAAVLSDNCTLSGCHNAQAAQPLTSYAELMIYVNNGSFERRVVEQQNMPPTGSLSDCEMEQITAWLAAGAPEN